MLRVDFDRWGHTPEDFRQLATTAAPLLPRDRGRARQGRPRRPARRGGGAASRGRPGATLDLAALGRLGGGDVWSPLPPRDDPPRPAPPEAVVEEGPQAARPGRPAAAGSIPRAGAGPAGRCPARPTSAGLPRRGAHPPGCRPWP